MPWQTLALQHFPEPGAPSCGDGGDDPGSLFAADSLPTYPRKGLLLCCSSSPPSQPTSQGILGWCLDVGSTSHPNPRISGLCRMSPEWGSASYRTLTR